MLYILLNNLRQIKKNNEHYNLKKKQMNVNYTRKYNKTEKMTQIQVHDFNFY